MKSKSCILILLLAAASLQAQTNNLTALLQQGLLEEQANHNLDAAIADYQSLALQFDKDRQLAASAIFRLGECYRMQGKTNEAALEYQRILHDFPDQTTLSTLSRQNLTGLGITSAEKARPENSDAKLWDQVKNLPHDQLERVLPRLAPDPVLTSLLQQRNAAEGKLAELTNDYSPQNPEVVDQKAALAAINTQITETIGGIMQALKIRAEFSQASTASSAPADSEDQEIARIQQMIQNSPDLINAPDGSGHTPLENAAIKGQLKVAAFLLDHGADINGGKVSALNQAANAGNRAMVEFLLSRGANINAKAWQGKTPLHTAAENGFQAVTEVLLANKADVNARDDEGKTPLFSAVQRGQLKIVQMLLAAGAKTNLEDNEGRTLLNYATIGGSPEMFKALLDAGTNPNTKDSRGRTPLSYATESDGSEVVNLLLAAKADPNGGKLDAPLLCAIHKQDAASAELLLKAGANPNAQTKADWRIVVNNTLYYEGGVGVDVTPLWLAVYLNQLPMVQVLLKYKADPNGSQTDGTPLIFAVLPHLDILAALLDAGANPNLLYRNNVPNAYWEAESPLMSAVGNSYYGTLTVNLAAAKLLLAHGANPNSADRNGDTALHWAVNLAGRNAWKIGPERREIVEVLLDHHADPNIRNNNGKTPLDLLKDIIAQTSYWPSAPNNPTEQKAFARELADLLRQYGALDNLPDWDHIQISCFGSGYSVAVFQRNTNDWNQFTLLETVFDFYESTSLSSSWTTIDRWAQYPVNPGIPFPDLARVTIMHPSHESTNVTRIKVNLLNGTGGIDCLKDVPLKFGDVVDIPERGHTLAESDTNGPEWIAQISSCLRSRSGTVKLIVAGGQTIQVQLDQFSPIDCTISQVLDSSQARNVLTSDSDLSRVKVNRRDPKTGNTREWIVDGGGQQPQNQPSGGFIGGRPQMTTQIASQETSSLLLRNGDVIEVPEKP